MKKIILPGLFLGAVMAFAPVSQSNAQIRNDRGTFTLPRQGDILVETQTGLFGSDGFFTLNDNFLQNLNNGLSFRSAAENQNYFPALKVRMFGRNNLVHRVSLNISYSSQNVTDSSIDYRTNSFGIAASYGIEKVFEAAERLNTYVGADATIGFVRAGEKWPYYDTHQSGFGFGIKAFTGMDYYVLPKVYLGMELGYGLAFNTYGNVHYYVGNNNTTNSNFTLTPYVTPVFRLGYVLTGKKVRVKHEPTYRSRYYDNDSE